MKINESHTRTILTGGTLKSNDSAASIWNSISGLFDSVVLGLNTSGGVDMVILLAGVLLAARVTFNLFNVILSRFKFVTFFIRLFLSI